MRRLVFAVLLSGLMLLIMFGFQGEPVSANMCADEIRLTHFPDMILVGDESVISAQLYQNGTAYALENVDVKFRMNNTDYATMVGGVESNGMSTLVVKTDAQGCAAVTIQSKDISNVHVSVTT